MAGSSTKLIAIALVAIIAIAAVAAFVLLNNGDNNKEDDSWKKDITGRLQVFGNANNGISENVQLTFYSEGGSTVKKMINNAPANWRLRSPHTVSASITDTIGGIGEIDIANASGDRGYSFACIIA